MIHLFRLLFDAALVLFLGAMLFQANQLPAGGGAGISPAFFPRLALVLGLVLTLCVLVRDVLLWLRERHVSMPAVSYKAVAYFVLLMVTTTGYVVFSEAMGFIVVTTLFLFVTVAGYKAMLVGDAEGRSAWSPSSLLSSLLFAAGFSLVAYVVFSYVFKVTLP
ncbi:tripartite tricarboxylate transporter TctB family protein [Salinicola sp. 4072]|uniref:tripartite tricarboxylate transporter TctB family protein n=1 Tax=Salinicola sp. 4072 TaxID=3082157 RepID=UPI002FC8FE2E